MTRRTASIRYYLGGGVLSLVTMLLFALPVIPLGIPGEWVWLRFRPEMMEWDVAILRILPVAIGLTLYIVAVEWTSRIVMTKSRMRTSLLLATLVIASFTTQWMVSQAAPALYATLKPRWVLYSPDSSGYFTEARAIDSTKEYLAGYEARTRDGDVLHMGTHPPGLVMVSRAAILLCEQSDWLTHILTVTEPLESRRLFRELESTAGIAKPLSEAEMAALRLVVLLTALAAALAVVPIFLTLCRLGVSRRTAWLATAFWPLVPAVVVFMPKSDALFAGLSALAFWLAVLGGTSSTAPRKILSGAGCGLFVFVAATLSLAILPVALMCGLFWMQPLRLRHGVGVWARGIAWQTAAGALVAFLGATLLVSAVTQCDLLTVWQLNLSKHAGFYDQYPRTFWKWLLVNPIELAFSLGLPLALLSLLGIAGTLLRGLHGVSVADSRVPSVTPATRVGQDSSLPAPAASAVFAVVTVWALLWLSGKNMGEAARLWILLMPLAVILAGLAAPGEPPQRSDAGEWLLKRESPDGRMLRGLLIFQAICCLITVAFVGGFDRLR